MVHNDLWADAGMADGYLCVGCLESRLGRCLRSEDFPDFPINWESPWNTPRLAARLAS